MAVEFAYKSENNVFFLSVFLNMGFVRHWDLKIYSIYSALYNDSVTLLLPAC